VEPSAGRFSLIFVFIIPPEVASPFHGSEAAKVFQKTLAAEKSPASVTALKAETERRARFSCDGLLGAI
jgi:hypothetical protein